jgi:cell division protein FtsZ
MMGTGEASGERRAIQAAEAAIANPLLDDVSMQGARGLLISIAGGPDLTLYEVDEAASRIREEVDADANIILGAMFDPTLDGTIRVSVVATGTDATMVQALEPVKANQSRQPLDVRRHQEAAAHAQQRPMPEVESQVEAAVAEAITHEGPDPAYEHDGVYVEPYVPAAAVEHHDDPVRRREPPVPTVHVPQRAERPDGQRRLPRTEELPAVARRSLVARETQDGEPRNARALFKRLASNVGFSIKPDGAPGREDGEVSAADDAAARSAIEAGTPRNPQVQPPSEGAAGQLDQHGRASPQPAQKEHLEIPAFLRKHG